MNDIISVFDTSIASYNIGNQIIMDSVNLELNEMFPESFIVKLPVEDIKTNARKYNSMSSISFVGGTNILNSNIRTYRQWDLTLHNILLLKNVLFLGCGWFQYESLPITRFTKWTYNKISSKKYIHSVRDEYTKQKLASIGIKSINTGCPTLWRLTADITLKIPQHKSAGVVITLTDYNHNENRDKILIETCLREYEHVYLFPQGTGDITYVEQLGYINQLIILPPKLEEFNLILETGNVDYIGTRLHAGIRALQSSVRAIIIGIDNRALEMSNDFGLPVLCQEDINKLSHLINQPYSLDLRIPFDRIIEWKKQFR